MKTIFLLTLFLFLFAGVTFAKIGVGVGTGKIRVTDKLKPGTIYQLPSLSVVNTGDQPSDYDVGISYHEKQKQLEPPEGWFIFTPKRFHLNPGKVQVVNIKLNLPIRIEPGDYFAYVEGRPAQKSTNGITSIGIAAAAKLYFTVVPGSFVEGIYFKLVSLWQVYAPWPQYILIGLGAIIVILLVKKFFHVEVNLKKPKDHKPHE